MATPDTPVFLSGGASTAFGRLDGRGPLDLICEAATGAVSHAGLTLDQIDGLLCGYATTLPHLMLSTLVCEQLGIKPKVSSGMSVGGATGAAMIMQAYDLIRAGRCESVLVVAGENRLSGQSRDASIQTLAQVGDPDFEVPNGASVPAYYALMASAYLQHSGLTETDLAEFAVLMRRHASAHPGAHLTDAIDVNAVMNSKPIASPLKLLDCCPISDGAVALVISARAGEGSVRIAGAGQAHFHQHLSNLTDVSNTGARCAADQAFDQAGIDREAIDYLAIYDSFTITLAMLLEEVGFAPIGRSAALAREGRYNADGSLPLNTHGGLLSFGHAGVAGGMAHALETLLQLGRRAGARQIRAGHYAYLHADGGVMSSHVGLILQSQ